MGPESSQYQARHMSPRHPKFLCQSLMCNSPLGIHEPDCKHVFLGEFGARMLLSSGGLLGMILQSSSSSGSTFARHVSHVVSVRPFEQMRIPTARRKVARMEHPERVGVFSMVEVVCHTGSNQASTVEADGSISVLVSGPDPWPTISMRSMPRRLVNVPPKAGNKVRSEYWKWFRLVSSHWISFQDLLVRAARARRTLSWPNLYCTIGLQR